MEVFNGTRISSLLTTQLLTFFPELEARRNAVIIGNKRV